MNPRSSRKPEPRWEPEPANTNHRGRDGSQPLADHAGDGRARDSHRCYRPPTENQDRVKSDIEDVDGGGDPQRSAHVEQAAQRPECRQSGQDRGSTEQPHRHVVFGRGDQLASRAHGTDCGIEQEKPEYAQKHTKNAAEQQCLRVYKAGARPVAGTFALGRPQSGFLLPENRIPRTRSVSTAAPTPSPASGAAPRRATKTVSTSPVNGSAMSEKSSGVVRRRKVRCGCRTKGCGESDKIEDGRGGQLESTRKSPPGRVTKSSTGLAR